jgi:hypothetical protein
LLGLSLPQAVEVELKTSHPVPTKQLARFDELAARLADAEDSYAVAVRADTDAAQAAATALAKLDGVLSQRYRVSALLDHVRKYGRGNAEAAMRQAMQLQAELAAAESENRQAIRQAEEISEVTRAASLNALLAREAAHIALRSAMPMISAQTPDWGPDIPLPVLVANYRDALVKALVADEVEARSYERTVQLLPPLKPARPSEPSQLPDQPDLSDQAHLSDQPQAEERSQPGAGAGPSAQLLAGGMAFTDEELLRALRSRQAELEHQADELDSQVVAAQERLGTMVKKARERSEEAEGALVATMLSWAREEAVATLEDARRRAAELGMSTDAPNGLGTLGKLLVTHFELQERLVNLTAEMALEVPSSD